MRENRGVHKDGIINFSVFVKKITCLGFTQKIIKLADFLNKSGTNISSNVYFAIRKKYDIIREEQ